MIKGCLRVSGGARGTLMRSVFGQIGVVCLCGLVSVVGCQEKTPSPPPAVTPLGDRAAPSPPVSKTAAQPAPNPEERFQRQYEVAVVVDGFMQAVRKQDWASIYQLTWSILL